MGKQFSLCVTAEDVATLEAELRKGEAFSIIQGVSDGPEASMATEGLHQQTRMVFLVLADDLPRLQLRPIPRGTLHRVDPITSPVIEYSPCRWNDLEVRCGRLFVEPRFFEGSTQVEKPERFIKWSNWVFSRCKEVLTFDRPTSTYWGAEASKLRETSALKILSQ